MEADSESEDERMLKERERILREDRRKQAEWYEKLNLFAEALRVYEAIEDRENTKRIKDMMKDNYGQKAKELEAQGRYQDAANLYYLIGDHSSVGRMKKKQPDLLILYDSEGEGLARLASSLDTIQMTEQKDDLFSQPNISEGAEEESDHIQEKEHPPKGPGVVMGEKGVPVKMPRTKKKKKMSFCPYCGEQMSTRKEPRFCPYCGEELT